MRHTYPSLPYPASYYDDLMCLKPPLLLWVAVLYFSRAITLPVAMAIGHFAGVDSRAIASFHAFWSIDALLPSLIAVLVLYALCRRVPTAPRLVRWIWARGRILLAVAAVLDMALIGIALIRQADVSDLSLLSLVAAAVDAYFLAYILAARRVRQAFSEFPAPVAPPESVDAPAADTHQPAAIAAQSPRAE
jgi:Protein of unknown function (DUF2919)